MPDVTTFLAFQSKAEEAAQLYVSTFEGRIVDTTRGPDGAVFALTFEILGQKLHAMNGGEGFTFGNGTSLFVTCDTQAEIDRYWAKLTADGGKEVGCGWVVDRFGVSWQIVPRVLQALLRDADGAKAGRAMQAMLKMKKLDIGELQRAHAG